MGGSPQETAHEIEGVTRTPEFSEEAEADIAIAALRYYATAPRFASDFLADIDEVLRNITEFPEMYQVVRQTARRAVLIEFPYSVIYRIRPKAIRVLAVLHSHSDPDHVRKRLDIDPTE